MIRIGFKMKVFSDKYNEYEKRHKTVYEELEKKIIEAEVKSYSIFLDEETGILFGYVELNNLEKWNKIPESEICKKWWKYMEDIMETNEDGSPRSVILKEVYHLEMKK